LTATGGALTIGDSSTVSAALGVNLSSTGGRLTIGANGGSGVNVTAYNGNINVSTDATDTIELGTSALLSLMNGSTQPYKLMVAPAVKAMK
jgi:hypothetical protein